jgi:hypothetical protein
MPNWITNFFSRSEKETIPVNRYEGFKENGDIQLRDRRGTAKVEIPEVSDRRRLLKRISRDRSRR